MIQIVHILTNRLFSPEFLALHRKNKKDFTRKRALPFPQLLAFMLNMVNGSLQSELSRFFQILHNQPVTGTGITPAGFCKARKKFSYSAFKDLNCCLTKTIYQSHLAAHWQGYRLLAVDSSITTLPAREELFEYFGKSRGFASHPSARLSQLYDVINKISVDVQVAPHSTGERELARKHLEHTDENDLLLYDRGYPATWLFHLHQQKKVHFCARITDQSNIIKNFLSSGKYEEICSFPCVEKSLRKCRKLGLPTTPITLRLLRIKLEGGGIEVLITSLLDKELFPHELFKALYHLRWGVEEDYKLMKSRLEIENFSGLSVEGIKQDVHAKVLTKNIAAVAILEASVLARQKYKHRKREYKINFTYALSQLKDNIVRLTLCLSRSEIISLLIEQIAKAVNAVRPGRRFVREKDQMRKRIKRHYTAYKRVG